MKKIAPNMVDYEKTRKEFKFNVPEFFNFTTDVIEKWAKDPKRVGLVIADAHGENFEEFTFAQLAGKANQFAQALLKRGVRKGENVIVILPRIHQWYAALLGMFKTGVIPVPTTGQSTARDILYRIQKAEAVAVVTDEENAAKIDEIEEQAGSLKLKFLAGSGKKRDSWIDFDKAIAEESTKFAVTEKTRSSDPMLIYFTSGTVAYPKMVLHSQEYAIGHEVTARFWHDLHPSDLHWTMTDTGWAKAAWGCIFGQWIVGAKVFLHNSPRFEAKTTLKLLEKVGVTSFCAPPTIYRIFAQEELGKYKFSSLRHCTSAGEPLNPEVIKVWKEATGCLIYDGYGQSETVNVVANYRCLANKPGSMGKPVPGFEVGVIDETGNEVAVNEEGVIAIKRKPVHPTGLFQEYWKDENATASVFYKDWYLTGDKARVDEDGYFWFIGRSDDIILTSGYRIGPFEVENALIEHPAVMEAAVVASPDDVRGEIVKAFVILSAGYEPSAQLVEELQKYVRKVTAPYKYPRKIDFVKELPKTISGKIRRGELKRKEWENYSRK